MPLWKYCLLLFIQLFHCIIHFANFNWLKGQCLAQQKLMSMKSVSLNQRTHCDWVAWSASTKVLDYVQKRFYILDLCSKLIFSNSSWSQIDTDCVRIWPRFLLLMPLAGPKLESRCRRNTDFCFFKDCKRFPYDICHLLSGI